MIKLSLGREYTFNYEDKDDKFSVIFDFPFIEDVNYGQMQEKIRKINGNKKKYNEMEFQNGFYSMIRKSLVSVTGIIDANTNKDVIITHNGKANEKWQKAVFEYLRSKKDLWDNILLAYGGELDQKNVNCGPKEILSTDGPTTAASPVKSETPAKDVDTTH